MSWYLLHQAVDFEAAALQVVGRELRQLGQRRRHRRELGADGADDHLVHPPLEPRHGGRSQLHEVGRVGHVGLLDAGGVQGLADRLVELLAVLLDQRLEEAHAEHLAFALVDAGGQVLVHVVAEHVAVQERAAAVRLHEELDHGLFLRFAAEDLGDRAFHFAAVAFVQEPRAPVDERIAADDEAGHAADAATDELALGDRVRRTSCGSVAQGSMLAIISRIDAAAVAQTATRPRLRP